MYLPLLINGDSPIMTIFHLQKRAVLTDDSLPEEFKLALAERMQQGIFSQVKNINPLTKYVVCLSIFELDSAIQRLVVYHKPVFDNK